MENIKVDQRGHINDIEDIHLLIEMSDRCNNKCIMCKHSWAEKIHGDLPASFMDAGLFIKVINDLKMSRIKVVSIDPLWAGESLMNPEFKEMISYMFVAIRRFGLSKGCVINTNAFFLDKEITEIFLQHGSFVQEHTRDGYYFRLYFSLDAASPDTYARIKQGRSSAMDRVIANIDYFMQQRKKRKLIIPNAAFQFIIMEENKHEARKFLRYWDTYLKRLGVKYEITPTWPVAIDRDAVYFRQVICPDIGKAIALHRNVCTRLGLVKKEKPRKNKPREKKTFIKTVTLATARRRPCAALWRTPNIQTSGVVTPCCRDIDLSLNLGNIKDCTIDQIWFGEKIRALRLAHIKGDLSNYPICLNCVEPEGELTEIDAELLPL